MRSRRQTVYEAAKQGDALALEVVRDTANFLGTGVANLLNIFNPDVVVIAGGVTQGRRQALRAAARRGAAPRVQAGGRGVPHRPGYSSRHRRRRRRGRDFQSAEAGDDVKERGARNEEAQTSDTAAGGQLPHSSFLVRRKRLGVIGTFVWDTLHGRDARHVPVEEWGGITYALSALDAALPEDWEIVPVMKSNT